VQSTGRLTCKYTDTEIRYRNK